MRPENFIPHLFIGVGETYAYYTLRETYLHSWVSDGRVNYEVRSGHLFNLSQDAYAAIEKAKNYAAVSGMELTNGNVDEIAAEMRDIKRATAEELERRAAAYKAQQDEWAAARQLMNEMKKETARSGIYPFGPFQGKTFRESSLGYANWLMDKVAEFEEGSLIRFVAEQLIEQCPDLRLPQALPDAFVGEVGKRLTFEVTIVKAASFLRPGYGWDSRPETCYITTMVTDAGECLVCFSGSFTGDVGEKLRIKGTIKEHTEYKGQAQTVIQRVKEV